MVEGRTAAAAECEEPVEEPLEAELVGAREELEGGPAIVGGTVVISHPAWYSVRSGSLSEDDAPHHRCLLAADARHLALLLSQFQCFT
jgi:hypothetical protein